MPKTQAAKRAGVKKRAAAGVGIDFRRAKRRVGRKLPAANNATDTTVKARAISLPAQSVAEERGGAPTARGLTLPELLAQAGHYAAKVRADALAGVGALAATHPREVARHAAATLGALAERAADTETRVRAALRPALAAAVAAVDGEGGLAPFVPLLAAHARRALTHVDAGVR